MEEYTKIFFEMERGDYGCKQTDCEHYISNKWLELPNFPFIMELGSGWC